MGKNWTSWTNYTPVGTSLKIHGALNAFDCYRTSYNNKNSILAINASGNKGLQELYCNNNELRSLELTGLTRLQKLDCRYNYLTNLDLRGLISLQELYCNNNELYSLNTSDLISLQTLDCYDNPCVSTTYGLDTIYCQLPQRTASDNARIYVTMESSTEPFVLATNGANANNNNWKVYGRRGSSTGSVYEITNTTGRYVCGTVLVTGVTLSPTTLSLIPGETANIIATVLPTNASNKSLTWSSNNTSAVKVSAGEIEGTAIVTAGATADTATITVTTEDGRYTATCFVTVTIPVTGVMLDKTTLNVRKGRSGYLTAIIVPEDATNKAVTWSSSDTTVFTVSAGDVEGTAVVTAVGTTASSATITVTTEDGGFTDTCLVTITIPVTGITLEPTTLNLISGETGNISAAVLPADATNKLLTWSSANPDIASVTVAHVSDVCIVKGMRVGSTTIIAKSKDGNFTATCLVTVAPNIVPVSSVSVSPSSLALKTGESRNIIATVLPADASNKSVTWSSDNPNIVTVDNAGKVTALVAGTATITVKTEDGSKTATCFVTVTIPVTGITLDRTALTIKKGESTSLTATVLPAEATNKKVTWSSDNPNIATVDNAGKVTALAVGTATITVTTEDGNKSATCAVTVEDDGSVEELLASGVNVWTFNDILHIDFNESVLSDRGVSIFDMSGKLVYSNATPSEELQIYLPNGVYIVKVGDIAFKVLITQ